MMWSVIFIEMILLSTCLSQHLINNGQYNFGVSTNSLSTRIGRNLEVVAEVPNLLASGVQTVKQLPYIEVLRLIESFVRLKGEISGKIWALIYDNSHIWAAIRDTVISKISTIHNLTLTAIITLRKVVEFALSLFGGIAVGFQSSGGYFG